MENLRSLVPIALSLVIAVIGSFFIYKWVKYHSAPVEVVKKEAEVVSIAVAGINLPWGTKLGMDMVKMAPFLKESLPVGYFSRFEDVEDRVLVSALKQGEPIIEHRLAPKDIKTGGVSAILSPGKRAIAVKGDKVIGISGFINPGNRVDVLVTLTDPKSRLEKTKLVLENILILATGTQMEENAKGKTAPVDVYTLEVNPEEGEKLALAATKGKLQFALRNVMDSESILTKGATISQTLASLSSSKPNKPEKKKRAWVPRDTSIQVEIIKGDQISLKKVK
jgi:pilus assembly protein CpaB